ncbi:MAG TPA: hypothetical protein VGG61_13820, partial [Gemmataceae bacterium]
MSPFLRVVVVLAGFSAISMAPAEPKPPSKDQVAKWIKQLGDAEFSVREKASEELFKAVVDDDTEAQVAEALQAARKGDDAEIVRRASEILERLDSGIRANTPKEVVDLWERFRSGDDAAKQEALKGLFGSGKSGLRVVRKLLDGEKDPNAKAALWQQIAQEAAVILPARMAEGDSATVEELLQIGLGSNQPGAQLAYAAYWLRRGKLAERIRALEAVKSANPESDAARLAPLYRVQGDWKKARDAAEMSKNEELVNAILFDQGAWKELAERAAKASVGGNDPNVLGLLARYQRLAGDAKGADETLVRIRESAQIDPFKVDRQQPARALLLNGRPDDALALIGAGPGSADAVELHCARYQFKEAMKIIDSITQRGPQESPEQLEILRARTLYLLGDHEDALKRLKSLGDNIGKAKAPPGGDNAELLPTALIEAEFRLGLKDLAFEHCTAMAVLHENEPVFLGSYLSAAFPDRASAAVAWWQYLRQKYPKEAHAETMKRLRSVLEGQMAVKDFTPLAEDAMRLGADMPVERREQWFSALAEFCQDMGADALAKSCLEKAVAATEAVAAAPKDQSTVPPPSTAALLRLADYYASKKDWTHAAERYGQAWEKDRKEPLPVFLRGLALVEAGQEKEGKRLMELAHD